MSEKMRATMHNGRAGKKGVYRATHNDRNFDTSEAEHIKGDRSKKNWTWQRYQKTNPNLTFDAAEKKFYEDNIGKSLKAQNDRHKRAGNLGRIKTIDEYRTSKQTCPEETILQIGKKGDTIPAQLLHKIAMEQINWEIKTFPNVRILDAAIHVDEDGAPHMHKRQVWTAKGKDGLTVSQNNALKEMGIERPDTSKKENRWNNAKMTYTEQCRQHFLDTCKKYGLDIEVEPKEASESGLSLLEYQRRQEQKKLEQLKAESEQLKKANEVEKHRQLSREKMLNDREASLDARQNALNALERELRKKSNELAKEKEKAVMLANGALEMQKQNKAWQSKLKTRENALDTRENSLKAREKSFTNRQQRAFEELQGMASYMHQKIDAKQLEMIRQTTQRVEDTKNFDAAVCALGIERSGMEV